VLGLRASLTPWGLAPQRNDFVRAGLGLIVLAILLFGGEMATKWHSGQFAYQREYGARAEGYERSARRYHFIVNNLEPHAALTYPCPICRRSGGRMKEVLKEALGKWLESERNAQWCRHLAASPFRATYNRTAADF